MACRKGGAGGGQGGAWPPGAGDPRYATALSLSPPPYNSSWLLLTAEALTKMPKLEPNYAEIELLVE